MNTDLINSLETLLEENNLSQSSAAKAMQVSQTTLNQFIKGIYRGNVDRIESLVKQFIERYSDKIDIEAGVIDFVLTDTVKRMLEVISIAHADGEINVIHGEAGLGKTSVLKHYKSDHNGVILIETEPNYSPKALLEELCDALGIHCGGSVHSLSRTCSKALSGSGRVLLIDEAENLPLKSLELIRRIHDKSGVGVILAGMSKLILNLKGKKGELAQLHSRVGLALNIGNTLPDADIYSIIENAGYSDVIADTFFTECKGSCRRLNKLFKRVKRMSRINDGVVTAGMIKQCSKMLIN